MTGCSRPGYGLAFTAWLKTGSRPPWKRNCTGSATCVGSPPLSEHTGVSLAIDAESLRPLVASVVAEALAALPADSAKTLAYTEPEAAELLGLHPHQLRDERRRGRIGCSRIVGNQVRYTRRDLLDYLARTREEVGAVLKRRA
jgi:hypothetical protein